MRRNVYAGRMIIQPKSGSSNSADRAKLLNWPGISTASQFTNRGITNSVVTACGLETNLVLGGSNCRGLGSGMG